MNAKLRRAVEPWLKAALDRGYKKGFEAGKAEVLAGLSAVAHLNGSFPKLVKAAGPADDTDEHKPLPDLPPPNDTDTGDADPHAAVLLAMLDYAAAAREAGKDPAKGVAALHALLDDPAELARVLDDGDVTPGTVTKAAGALILKAAKWDADKHPRDDNGRFVSKDAIAAAKDDPAKAEALRERVTDPAQRKKLDAALAGDTDLGRTKKGEAKHQAGQRKQAEADRRAAVGDLLKRAAGKNLRADALTADDLAAFAEHIPAMTVAELRRARQQLGASFGGSRKRDGMVSALLAHAHAAGADATRSEFRADPDKAAVLAEAVAAYKQVHPDATSEQVEAIFGPGTAGTPEADVSPAQPEPVPEQPAPRPFGKATKVKTTGAGEKTVEELEAVWRKKLGKKFGSVVAAWYGSPGNQTAQIEVRAISDGYHGRQSRLVATYEPAEPLEKPARLKQQEIDLQAKQEKYRIDDAVAAHEEEIPGFAEARDRYNAERQGEGSPRRFDQVVRDLVEAGGTRKDVEDVVRMYAPAPPSLPEPPAAEADQPDDDFTPQGPPLVDPAAINAARRREAEPPPADREPTLEELSGTGPGPKRGVRDKGDAFSPARGDRFDREPVPASREPASGPAATGSRLSGPHVAPKGTSYRVTDELGRPPSPETQAKINRVVGDLPPDHLAALANAPDGAAVRANYQPWDDSVMLTASQGKGDGQFLSQRILSRGADGKLQLTNDQILIGKTHPLKGRGIESFANQVRAAKAAGVDRLVTSGQGTAADQTSDEAMNGYYTWPRAGYDGEIPEEYLSQLPPDLAAKMGGKTNIGTLMETPEGRAWWKANGGTLDLTFDLADGSPNMRKLEAYLAERAGGKTRPAGTPGADDAATARAKRLAGIRAAAEGTAAPKATPQPPSERPADAPAPLTPAAIAASQSAERAAAPANAGLAAEVLASRDRIRANQRAADAKRANSPNNPSTSVDNQGGKGDTTPVQPAAPAGDNQGGGAVESTREPVGWATVTGDTFPHKDAIAAAGGQWDSVNRVWRVPARQAGELASRPGVQVAYQQPRAETALPPLTGRNGAQAEAVRDRLVGHVEASLKGAERRKDAGAVAKLTAAIAAMARMTDADKWAAASQVGETSFIDRAILAGSPRTPHERALLAAMGG